jgi:two-component sensor histidine kinase
MNYEQNLLAEMRHRVTNDLALIVGMLETERRYCSVLTADEALDNAVGALMSLTIYYRRLYETASEVDLLELDQHLESVVNGLRNAYLNRLGVTVDCRFETVLASPVMARDLGLIIVELVANAAKHAFANHGGRVGVELCDTAEGLVCRVSDDGCGLDAMASGRTGGGLAVASRLAAHLGGSLEVGRSPRWRGAAFVVKIPWGPDAS